MPFPDLSWDLTAEEERKQRTKLSRALRKYKRRKSILNKRFLSLWYKVLRREEKEKLDSYDSQTGVKALATAGYHKLAESWKALCLKSENSGTSILNIGENVILFLLAAKDSTSFTQFVTILTLFVKTYVTDKAIVAQIVEQFISQEFPKFASQSEQLDDIFDEWDDDDATLPDWESQTGIFSTLLDSFTTVRESKAFSKVSTLISTLLSLGFLSETKTLSYSLKGMELFRVSAHKGHKNCLDLVEVILTTMQFIVERGWKCFTTGTLDPFLFEDDSAVAFQLEYTDFVTKYEYVKIGEWDKSPWLDANDFELKLTSITEKCRLLLRSASPHDRVLVARHLENLEKITTDFELTRNVGGLRMAPFTFLVHGPSSVAKSTIVNNLTIFALQQLARLEGKKDYIVDPQSICTLNEMDKYHSDYKAHIQAVLLDDLANAKMSTTGVNPSVNVINFINNIRRTAIMAEANLKGKIQLNPKVVAATTNNWIVWANDCSCEPVSLLRRFQLHIKVSVKKEYRENSTAINGSKLAEDAANGVFNPDAWDFEVLKCYGVSQDSSNESAQTPYFRCAFNGTTNAEPNFAPKKVGMKELLDLMKREIETHYKIQHSVVSSSEGIFAQCLCDHGNSPRYCDDCYDSQFGESARQTYDEYILTSNWKKWENYVPQTKFDTLKFQFLYTLLNSNETLHKLLQFSAISMLVCLCLFPLHVMACLGTLVTAHVSVFELRRQALISELAESRGTLPIIFQNIRDADIEMGKVLFAFAGIIVTLVTLYKIARKFSTPLTSQGNGMSVHLEPDNVWLTPSKENLPSSAKSNVQSSHLANLVVKQLVYIEIGGRFNNGLAIGGNMMMIPGHAIPSETATLKCVKEGSEVLSTLDFEAMINPEDCVRIEDTDLALAYVPRLGDRKDLIPYFPDKLTEHLLITEHFHRDIEGNLSVGKTRFKNFVKVKTPEAEFSGPRVVYDKNTFRGQCMSPHIYSDSSQSFLAGFHAAGKTGKSEGALTRCTRDQIEKAIAKLSKRTTVFMCTNSGEVPTSSYGIDFTPTDHIADKSPTRFQVKAQAAIFGTMPTGAVRPKSAVVTSVISEDVEEIMGNKREHGKPANCRKRDEGGIPHWEPYQKYLAGAGDAYQEFPSDILKWATEDYMSEIESLIATPFGKDLLNEVRILDDVETVSGLDGVRFIDQMKPSTSMGWPINKAKTHFLSVVEHDTLTCPRILDDETLAIAARARSNWLNNQRSYDIFKTCTKDEPTKLTKLKVRCFQASPAALQFNIRKYFLTSCRFLSCASLKTECAVGVNAEGPGWHELNEFITKFGTSNIVAGDFSAFDQNMSARMVLQAAKIFEFIAKSAGFDDDTLKIMKGAFTEIAYPIMSLNGELIQLYGSNPSGQNLTVYVNSIVNSLYHRCVFRILYPDFKGSFSEAVALMTYGDDAKMSVNKAFPAFNHTNIQATFAKYGIKYTMAEKEAASVPFVEHEDADFLKRKSRFEPGYKYTEYDGTVHEGMWISMLDEDSIYKSLHSNLKSKKESLEAVAIDCLEGAARSWFFYGPEVFAEKHELLKAIVAKKGWERFVSDTFWNNYAAREESWLQKYSVIKV